MPNKKEKLYPSRPENMTRVFFNLPCRDNFEMAAFRKVLEYLHSRMKDTEDCVKGLTTSSWQSPVFVGDWNKKETKTLTTGKVIEKNAIIRDRHAILNVDVKGFSDDNEISAAIEYIHAKIAEFYIGEERPQFQFWITSHPVVLHEFPGYEDEMKKILAQKTLID